MALKNTVNKSRRKKERKQAKIEECINAKELKALPYKEYLNTKHWKKVRDKVKARDKRCKLCNGKAPFNIHHRSYRNKGKPNKEINDLVLLCADCHDLFHKYKKII